MNLRKKTFMFRLMAGWIICSFVSSAVIPSGAHAQALNLPAPGTRISLSPGFTPPLLKGIKVFPDDPFRIDFILDKGDSAGTDDQVKTDSNRLIKYFLASLTVPEKDLWVNLSPYEKDRTVPDAFGRTEMGRDLLAQDYMLKQITASVFSPDGELGRAFWARVYAEAQKRYGTTDIPVDTFNKVWIMADKAVVYDNKDTAFVAESRLKVLLEEDYLALKQEAGEGHGDAHTLASNVIREVIIPALEKEVNEGRNFSTLRQVYRSLILAIWYRKKLQGGILTRAYVGRNKVAGINIRDPFENQKIYSRYVQAFRDGAFNYIKEEVDRSSGQMIPRKYFSGGLGFMDAAEHVVSLPMSYSVMPAVDKGQGCCHITTRLQPLSSPERVLAAGHILLIPDGKNSTRVEMGIPPDVRLSMVEKMRKAEDFSMTSDGQGSRRLRFRINSSVEKIRSFLNFVPWERHAAKVLVAGTMVFSFVALSSQVPERAITVVDMVLVAFILLLELLERQEKRFLSDHDYWLKVLERFYDQGVFSNGHSAQEVMRFYRRYYQEFVDNLDDDREEETLELLVGTLPEKDILDLTHTPRTKFEERLGWAWSRRAEKYKEFMKAHQGYGHVFQASGQENLKGLSQEFVTQALQFYNTQDHAVRYFLSKTERDDLARFLAGHIPAIQKSRIIDVGPHQPSVIQQLMYWDLVYQAVDTFSSSSKDDSQSTEKEMSMKIRNELEGFGFDWRNGKVFWDPLKNRHAEWDPDISWVPKDGGLDVKEMGDLPSLEIEGMLPYTASSHALFLSVVDIKGRRLPVVIKQYDDVSGGVGYYVMAFVPGEARTLSRISSLERDGFLPLDLVDKRKQVTRFFVKKFYHPPEEFIYTPKGNVIPIDPEEFDSMAGTLKVPSVEPAKAYIWGQLGGPEFYGLVKFSINGSGQTHENEGGVDLTTGTIDWRAQDQGGREGSDTDFAMLRGLDRVTGISPMIVSIQPVTDMKSFFHIK